MNKIIIPSILIVISLALVVGVLTYSNDDTVITEEVEIETSEISETESDINQITTPSPEPEPVSTPTASQTGLGFSVNVSGDMHDKSFFTISGTIPDQPRHLTGTIRTGEGNTLKIVYLFQIELDNGINVFEEKVGISEDFLWQEDTTYVVSINHGEIIKEIEFYRGTESNNFNDSVVPIV